MMIFARTLCLLFVFLLAQAFAAQGTTLTIQGDDYKSTCSSPEWERLKPQVANAASGVQVDTLMPLIRNVLCGKGLKADFAVRQASIVPMKLTTTSTGDGTVIVTRLMRSQLAAYGGAAWNATADMGDDGLNLHFYKNEACVETLTFRKQNKAWHLAAIEEACD